MDIEVRLVPIAGERESFLSQWDTDRRIMIKKTDDLIIDEVHFANSTSGDALSVEFDENNELSAIVLGRYVVAIPNVLLQNYMPITIFIVMHSLHGKRTVYRTSFKVEKRPKPSNYINN